MTERYLRITMTDNGETWGVDIDRGDQATNDRLAEAIAARLDERLGDPE